MCKIYTIQYSCAHTRPIELCPCGDEISAFACYNGVEIILLLAPLTRGKGKCRECRRIDAQRWREGKEPINVADDATMKFVEGAAKEIGPVGKKSEEGLETEERLETEEGWEIGEGLETEEGLESEEGLKSENQ